MPAWHAACSKAVCIHMLSPKSVSRKLQYILDAQLRAYNYSYSLTAQSYLTALLEYIDLVKQSITSLMSKVPCSPHTYMSIKFRCFKR